MEGLSDSELDKRYVAIFATKGPELEREQVIDAIMANSPAPGSPTLDVEETEGDNGVYVKSKDNGREFFIPNNAKGLIAVRQVNVDTLNGGMVEVPNTETLQFYTKEVFDRLVKSEFFSESKLKVEILRK